MMIKRKKVTTAIEELFLKRLVVSGKFCREMQRVYDSEYISSPHIATVANWCVKYYEKYKTAPREHIRDVFIAESKKLAKEDRDIINLLLSKTVEPSAHNKINTDYAIDQTIRYFKKKSLELKADRIEAYLNLDKVEEAEDELLGYKEIARTNSQWVNPFTKKEIRNYFEDESNHENELFKLPGKLGEVIGYFERGTLVGILAPTKRGKSFYLQEISVRSVLEKLNTVYISLEMGAHKVKRRLYRRISATGPAAGDNIYPVFDCRRNQDNTCRMKKRENRNPLLNKYGKFPIAYDPEIEYAICNKCRGTDKFIPAVWFEVVHRPKMTEKGIAKLVEGMFETYGDHFRFLAYPNFSANLAQIIADLDKLEMLEGFIPDVVVIDYGDILAPEDKKKQGREVFDETWKTMKKLADSKFCLVVSASQGNRASIDKRNLSQKDVAEEIRKIAHGDLWLALNQLPIEKRRGVMRVNVIAQRDGDYDEGKMVTVLEQRGVGQVLLDSEILPKKMVKKKEEEN